MTFPLYDPDSLENRDPAKIAEFLDRMDPVLERFFHPRVSGLQRIPSGPTLYVANHNAGVLMPDVFIVASAIFRQRGLDDLPFALAHDLALKAPALNRMLCPLGAVRARAGTAERILAAGHKALVYPGGDVEVMRPFSQRDKIVFGQRRGYVKLALRAGVPISPIVTAGAHSAFVVLDDGGNVARALGLDRWARVNVRPTILSFPWGLTFGVPPPYVPMPTRIRSEVLAPIHFAWTGEEAAADEKWVDECHRRVVDTMQTALTRLARERREERRQDFVERVTGALNRAMSVLGIEDRPATIAHGAAKAPSEAPPVEFEHVSGLDGSLGAATDPVELAPPTRIAA